MLPSISFKVKRLLEWSRKQDGYYYLPTTPAVLIIYNTEEREGADDEMLSIAQVMPKFGLIPTIKKNCTEDQIYAAIREVGLNIHTLICLKLHGNSY